MSPLGSHPELVAHFRCVCSEHLLSCLDCGPKALAANLGRTEESWGRCELWGLSSPRTSLSLCGSHALGLSGRVPPAPAPPPGIAPGLEGHPSPCPGPWAALAWRDTIDVQAWEHVCFSRLV